MTLLVACHKTPSAPTVIPNKFLATSFPKIDTATFWHIDGGHLTGAKARISMDGYLTVTGYASPGGTYSGGKYRMQLPDTSIVSDVMQFRLYQDGNDSTYSTFNVLERSESAPGSRRYYHLTIRAGAFPAYTIVGGDFVDSL